MAILLLNAQQCFLNALCIIMLISVTVLPEKKGVFRSTKKARAIPCIVYCSPHIPMTWLCMDSRISDEHCPCLFCLFDMLFHDWFLHFLQVFTQESLSHGRLSWWLSEIYPLWSWTFPLPFFFSSVLSLSPILFSF